MPSCDARPVDDRGVATLEAGLQAERLRLDRPGALDHRAGLGRESQLGHVDPDEPEEEDRHERDGDERHP